ncbi:MAG: hypothetical protein QXM04_01125 [Nanopusillaceae archaeon]
MVKGILKKIEGTIALIIFILFLIFYFNVFSSTIFNNSSNEIYRKIQIIEEIYNKLIKEGYIISFRTYISKYSNEILCNLNNEELRIDLCYNHPFFIPMNLSFLLKYNGILNNTNNTIFKRDLGGFLYLNLSSFECEEEEYILIEVKGPIYFSKIVFVTTPTVYYWLNSGFNITIESNEEVKFSYCYLSKNKICSESNSGESYGIIIIIDYLESEKAIFNISKSINGNAEAFNIQGLDYFQYKIIFEPKCFLDLEFLILENIYYDFKNYTDLNCSNYFMNNSKIYYNFQNKTLMEVYYNLSLYKEDLLRNPNIENVKIACIQYYKDDIFNIYRVLFSNSSWFFEMTEYNFSNLNQQFNLFDWSSELSNFIPKKYFNFTDFIHFRNESIFINKILLQELNNSYCKYVLLFFDDIYNITFYHDGKADIVISNNQNLLRPRINYFCTNQTTDSLAISVYYGYSVPKYELKYINKVFYIDVEDLKEDDKTSFYLKNLNISIGNKIDKLYSKGYNTYIKYNNRLIEDYLIIYTK